MQEQREEINQQKNGQMAQRGKIPYGETQMAKNPVKEAGQLSAIGKYQERPVLSG
jgi:hypothetical protein